MQSVLAGIETEYGFHVEGHTPSEQVQDAQHCVESYPGRCHVGWDYGPESPRSDLRGFRLDHLAFDPTDAQFESAAPTTSTELSRADRVLGNGARLYNDHGHPEYATPECRDDELLARHDAAGEWAVLQAARCFEEKLGRRVKVYKNNTDFHGASYGTHESYLVPRELGFERMYRAVMPMLVARQILTGAGKVGAETGPSCHYQISQRADFFMEPFNAETLYRRPVFNTRDEPHADPRLWMRLHVISGDANMMMRCTERKLFLVKLALQLAMVGEAPHWAIADPVHAFQSISRDVMARQFRVDLANHSHTDAYEILESYFAAAEAVLSLDETTRQAIEESRSLLQEIRCEEPSAEKRVDWLAKRSFIDRFVVPDGTDWGHPGLASWDLAYHDVDPEESIFHGLVAAGEVDPQPAPDALADLLDNAGTTTRANARGIAARRFSEHLEGLTWSSVTLRTAAGRRTIYLDPSREYPDSLAQCADVDEFADRLEALGNP